MIFTERSKTYRISIIIILTVLIYIVSFISLAKGNYDIIQGLFYIPVILSCFWFGRKGFLFSVFLATMHFFMCNIFDPDPIWEELARLAELLTIGAVTFKLAGSIKMKSSQITYLNGLLHADNERFRKSEMLSNLGSYEIDLETGKTVWSDELYRIFGYQPGDFEPTRETRIEFAHPEDRELVRSNISIASEQGACFRFESRIVRKDGSIRWVMSMGYTVLNEYFEVEKFIGSLLDITDRKELERSLREKQESLKITIASIGDGVISTDTDGNVTILNKVAEDLTGWKLEEALGKPVEEVFHIISEHTREKSENPVHRVLESGLTLGLANHTALISRDGTERAIADSAAPIRDDNGNIQGVIMVFRDVTAEKQRQNEIYYQSYYDSLSGLYNRRFYEEELERIDTEDNLPLSLIMGDVNGLKLINDAFGHAQGDILIRNAAKVIKSMCRPGDIAARIGGDEFVILMPRTNKDEAEEVAEKIKSCCSDSKIGSVNVSIAFGCCTKENSREELSKIFKNAEDLMYKHKIVESGSMRGSIIQTIFNTLQEKNPKVGSHSKRVSQLCRETGIAMNLHETEIYELKVSGLLHDIGKIGVDESILNKPEKLTEHEMNLVKSHSDIGYRILSSSLEMTEIAHCILSHHEWFNGNGYPRGLKRGEIPLLSRIIAVADAYDAMTNERTYKKSLDREAAICELRKYRGSQFDPGIVDVFIEKVV